MDKRKNTADEDRFEIPVMAQSSSTWDLDRDFTEEELKSIDAAFLAATPTSSSSSRPATKPDQNFRGEPSETRPKTRRRLPGYLCSRSDGNRRGPELNGHQSGHEQMSSSFALSPCPRNWGSHQTSMKIGYPAMNFEGHVVYSRSIKEVEAAVSQILMAAEVRKHEAGHAVLGVDIEWKPTFKKGVPPGKVATVQVCGEMTRCHVMHIIHSGIPKCLVDLLEDPTFIKVGVNIDGDSVKLFHDYNVSITPVEDLSRVANQKLVSEPKNWSLSSLVETLTHKQDKRFFIEFSLPVLIAETSIDSVCCFREFALLKPKHIRLGNWEVRYLSKAQLKYAATDAFASWYIYEVLKSFPDIIEDNPSNQGFDQSCY